MPTAFDHAYRPFQSGQPASTDDLAALEQAAHGRLPADYRAFLLRCNGGSLRPFGFELAVPQSDFNEKVHALDYLYELKEVRRRSQLAIDPGLRNIPPGRLAIGTTVSELTITLDITEATHGQVQAWVRDTFNVWGEGANTRVVPLAASFTAFLALLRELPETYVSFWASFGQAGEQATRVTLP